MNASTSAESILLASLDRQGTIGMGYLGAVVSALIYGITCIQTIQYYRSPRSKSDVWFIRVFVLVLWLLDGTHQAMVVHAYYEYLVIGFGDLTILLSVVWTVTGSILVNGFIYIIVRLFYLQKIWILSHNIYIVVPLAILAFARFGLNIDYFYQSEIAAPHILIEAERDSRTMGLVVLAFEVGTTTLYTGTLVYYLLRMRPEFRRSNDIVSKIVLLVIGSSMLSILVAIGQLVSYIVAPTKLYTLFFDNILETVDANAALTSLNSRDYFNEPGEANSSTHPANFKFEGVSFPGMRFNNLGTVDSSASGSEGTEDVIKIEC